jgi:type II secretion system protein I
MPVPNRPNFEGRPRLQSRVRHGFTLLEIILALTILAMSLAALGEVLRLASDNSSEACDLTQAQLIAAGKLAELTSGAIVLDNVNNAPVEEVIADPQWLYSIEMTQTQELGLLAVRVTVRQDLPDEQNPAEYSVVRWMPDPAALATGTGTASSGTTGGAASGGAAGGSR